jgi:hypothetical protein
MALTVERFLEPLIESALDEHNYAFEYTERKHSTLESTYKVIVYNKSLETILTGEARGQPSTHRFVKRDGSPLLLEHFIFRFRDSYR